MKKLATLVLIAVLAVGALTVTNASAGWVDLALKEAKLKEDADADYRLGEMYLDKGDYEAAAEKFALAAENGSAEAQNALGKLYEDGQGVEQDYARAVELYTLAAGQGFADAQFNLGVMYYYGQGVGLDYARAAELFEQAAEQGLAEAQYYLGLMYYDGQGVEQDESRGIALISQAIGLEVKEALIK